MSFVTTHPESLMAAASSLQGIGSAMAAQNAAATAPTTGVAPAAADEVSALQATQFAAYGTLYQQVSAQATAIHEMIVNTLGASADSYGATEATNAASSTAESGLSGLLALLTGNGQFGLVSSTVGNGGVIAAMQLGNFGSAASDFSQLGSAGFVTDSELSEALDGAGEDRAVLTGAVAPAAPAGGGATTVAAGMGQASSAGRLSVPASWGGAITPTASPVAAALPGAGAATAAAADTPVAAMPAGMPAAAGAGRAGPGPEASRYGVKPTWTPRPPIG